VVRTVSAAAPRMHAGVLNVSLASASEALLKSSMRATA
jgi:hypothetical protein